MANFKDWLQDAYRGLCSEGGGELRTSGRFSCACGGKIEKGKREGGNNFFSFFFSREMSRYQKKFEIVLGLRQEGKLANSFWGRRDRRKVELIDSKRYPVKNGWLEQE